MKDERAKKDEYQKALAIFSEAMKEFRKAKFGKTIELLKSFVEKHPGERELVDRARLYIKIAEERSRESKEVVSLKTTEDYYHYGLYRMNAGDFEEAQKLLDKALKLKPDDGMIYYALADLNSLVGQTDASLEYLKKAIQVDKYFRVLAQNETDFQPLWEDKKFKLITRIV